MTGQQTESVHRASAADLVIAVRVTLAFVAIGLFSLSFPFAVAAVVLTIVVISMDALDGIMARRLGVVSDLGGVLDITADRIVEHVFWIYFAVAHLVPVWVPLVIVTRSFVVDTVRGIALTQGRTAFGDKTMMGSRLSRFLVASRFMRNLYGVGKVAAFVLLGAIIAVQKGEAGGWLRVTPEALATLQIGAFSVVVVTVFLCVVRGLPVVWDSRTYLGSVGSGA